MDDMWELDGLMDKDNATEVEEDRNIKKRRIRGPSLTHVELDNTVWGQMLKHPDINNPESDVAIKFRLRFRIPYGVFKNILVPQCVKENVFDLVRESRIPIEYKLLVCLRIIGRGHDFDTLNEISLIPVATCHHIFHTFVRNFNARFFDMYVYMPVGNELIEMMNVYKMLGFNGAIGSIDCTHVKWNKCPVNKQNYCIGKENYPTLSFQCVVNHSKRVMMVSKAHWGAANDKLIVRNVPETFDFLNGKYSEIKFSLYDENGQTIYLKGGFFIVDGGFF